MLREINLRIKKLTTLSRNKIENRKNITSRDNSFPITKTIAAS